MRTTDVYLKELLLRNNIKCNIVCSDELNKLKKTKIMNIIINLETSRQSGSHWVSLYKNNNNYIYCDSYGVSPDKNILQFCKKNLGCNTFIIQNINSTNCGLFCVSFLYYMNTNKGDIYEIANDYVNLFEPNTILNDKILSSYLNKTLLSFTKDDNKYL